MNISMVAFHVKQTVSHNKLGPCVFVCVRVCVLVFFRSHAARKLARISILAMVFNTTLQIMYIISVDVFAQSTRKNLNWMFHKGMWKREEDETVKKKSIQGCWLEFYIENNK